MQDLLTDDDSREDLSYSLRLERSSYSRIGLEFKDFLRFFCLVFGFCFAISFVFKLATSREFSLQDPQLSEQLKSFIEQEISLELAKQLEEITAKIQDRVNSVQNERPKCKSKLQLDETMLNVAIRMQIQKLVLKENLENSKPDYASELNNAVILRASSTYSEPNAFKIFGLPIWSLSSPPAHLLKRSTQLFEIYSQPWKMDGQSGYFKIKLAKPIVPSAFAYVHPLRSSILDENQISCAPKVIRVIGYEKEASNDPLNLGQFTYEIDNQNYEKEFAFEKAKREITVLKFDIKANHGHPNYTCLHKIKIF